MAQWQDQESEGFRFDITSVVFGAFFGLLFGGLIASAMHLAF